MGDPNVIIAVMSIAILIMSAVVHECAHGYAALLMGDDTAYLKGRLTLNPLPHIDPFMSIILPTILYFSTGFVLGGAKPVPINPLRMRRASFGLMVSAAAGPASNFALAVTFTIVWALTARWTPAGSLAWFFFLYAILINVLLGCFNLIPIPPLDGSRILRHFLPLSGRNFLDRLERFGMIIILALFMSGILEAPLRWMIGSVLSIIALLHGFVGGLAS